MLNLTILSLSTSNIFSFSPIYVGNNMIIKHSTFRYYFPTIFLNPANFHIENCFLSHGLGALIHVQKEDGIEPTPLPTPHPTATPIFTSLFDKTFDSDTQKMDLSQHPGAKRLVSILFCHFSNIKMTGTSPFIDLAESNAYMTSCVIDSCSCYKISFIKFRTRANTVSHICCSNFNGYKTGDSMDHQKTMILDINTVSNSFLKFYYSTFYGPFINANSKIIIQIQGNAALRYQCNNISNYYIEHYTENNVLDRCVLSIIALKCLYMVMNTFYDLSADQILYINPQDKEGYPHYLAYSNFCHMTQHVIDTGDGYCIRASLNDGTQLHIEDCFFFNLTNNNLLMTNRVGVTVSNCIFDNSMNKNGDADIKNDNLIGSARTSNILAHFFTEGCAGEAPIEAFGCQNDTCPDKGCLKNAFDFDKDNDLSYTQVYHEDVDTPPPTPTGYFTESTKFSESTYFTKSFDFSESGNFSSSFYFSSSTEFTKTSYFSETTEFSMTTKFTQSTMFSDSTKFSSSFFFTKTDYFSKSTYFTKSSYFSGTLEFSYSTYFTESFKFTKSDDFLPTNIFHSETDEFSKSNMFSKSFVFSDSDCYSSSLIFSLSDQFSKSKTLLRKSVIVIDIKTNDRDSITTGMKVGIGATCAAVVVILILIGLFLLRRRKLQNIEDIREENIEIADETASSIVNQNPLIDLMSDDDPFGDEFE